AGTDHAHVRLVRALSVHGSYGAAPPPSGLGDDRAIFWRRGEWVAVTAFGEIEVDLAGHEIRRSGVLVPGEPQVFGVLAYWVTHRDRMVPKTELLDEVWGDRFVSESALTSRIKSARRAIGDTGRDQRAIKTIHSRGYRFVADVVAADDGPEGPGGP